MALYVFSLVYICPVMRSSVAVVKTAGTNPIFFTKRISTRCASCRRHHLSFSSSFLWPMSQCGRHLVDIKQPLRRAFSFSFFFLLTKWNRHTFEACEAVGWKANSHRWGNSPRRGQFDQSAQQWVYLWKFAFPDGKWWMELRIVGHMITVRLATKNKREKHKH